MADKVKITIDGTVYEVNAGENLLQVCLDRGLLVPHFCYHEALGAVGSCRLCAAMIAMAPDKPPRLDMMCMNRCSDGMVISVKAAQASKFRKEVIEDLMLNHPHDCPVCDEGGECMLQDMTVLCEQQHRRTRFRKRSWVNQYLGPLIHHEMNRCITCYRCVRFYRDYALGDDFSFFGSRSRIYFGRVADGVLQNEFAGNIVDVCPTGVFTNKRFREIYCRPWDLKTARSVCVHCSVGCNVLPGYHHTQYRRNKPVSNPAVNKFFLCDRGRYGSEYLNSPSRLRTAFVRGREMPALGAIKETARLLQDVRQKHGPDSVAVLGSVRASCEANTALSVLLASLEGSQISFFRSSAERAAVRRAAAITASRTLKVPSLPDIERADCVFNVGGDLNGEAPMLDLAVRQAIRNGHPYYSLCPRAGKLDRFAEAALHVAPAQQAPILTKMLDNINPGGRGVPSAKEDFGSAAAVALGNAERPVILCSALHGDTDLIEAALTLARKLHVEGRPCGLAFYFPGANAFAAGITRSDTDPEAIWDGIRNGKIKGLVILERNPSLEFRTPEQYTELAGKCEFVAIIDCYHHAAIYSAGAVLPCVPHYQGFGTLLNYEGRAQSYSGLPIPDRVTMTSSEILMKLAEELGTSDALAQTRFHDIFDVIESQSTAIDSLSPGGEGVLVKSAGKLAAGPVQMPQHKLHSKDKQPQKLLLWETYHCFGSEELSSMAPPVAELAPGAVVEMHPDDAAQRRLKPDQEMDLTQEMGIRGVLKLNPGVAHGIVSVPVRRVESALIPEEATR